MWNPETYEMRRVVCISCGEVWLEENLFLLDKAAYCVHCVVFPIRARLSRGAKEDFIASLGYEDDEDYAS